LAKTSPVMGAIKKEIVPLDRGTDGGCDDSTAKLDLMFGGGKLNGIESVAGHGLSPGRGM